MAPLIKAAPWELLECPQEIIPMTASLAGLPAHLGRNQKDWIRFKTAFPAREMLTLQEVYACNKPNGDIQLRAGEAEISRFAKHRRER